MFLAERVTRVILVSTVGPLDDPAAGEVLLPRPLRLTLALARRSPALALPLVWRCARQTRVGALDRGLPAWMSPADAAVLSRPEVAACLQASTIECFRRGLRGAAQDTAAVAHGEGFSLEDIATEVQIWHGGDDRSDPVAIARSLQRRIPRASARTWRTAVT